MATPTTVGGSTPTLKRSVGFYGLTFISLGSIIGSGWLLGALGAAQAAGPASLLSWVLAAVMLSVLALIHAELGSAYPASGGTARFPLFAFGTLAGFTAGWATWLQAVAIAPIEVEASLSYLNHITWVGQHLNMLHVDGTLTPSGIGIASLLMVIFTIVNIIGVKLLSDSNTITVIWKTAVPVLTVIVLISLTFHGSNFSAGGGFAPFGAHGVFAALPAGVVFALQGFEQAIQVSGEAKNPQRDVSRAVIVAMLIGAVIYISLEVAFIAALDPHNLIHGWANPIAKGDFGPYASLAGGAGAAWLAYILYADAFVSPAGTGLIYIATSARATYAMSRSKVLPGSLGTITVRGVPLWSIILAFVVGELSFLPFPSWQSLVGIVTSATAIMYAFAPVSLAALRLRDPDRPRPYKLPAAKVLAPIGFVFANLIIYWGGFEATWKLLVGIFIGRVLFEITLARTSREDHPPIDWRASSWIWPWLVGMAIIGFLGRYGTGAQNVLPNWWDLVAVIAFSLVIFFFAVSVAMSSEDVQRTVAEQEAELATEPELGIAG
ncbi:MAG TPA: APC family permease [Pseudonocardiaceae bacterium]|nr:APC family permease [Pseudonocardiaceae bacterium]